MLSHPIPHVAQRPWRKWSLQKGCHKSSTCIKMVEKACLGFLIFNNCMGMPKDFLPKSSGLPLSLCSATWSSIATSGQGLCNLFLELIHGIALHGFLSDRPVSKDPLQVMGPLVAQSHEDLILNAARISILEEQGTFWLLQNTTHRCARPSCKQLALHAC